jgi:hypothetical protein
MHKAETLLPSLNIYTAPEGMGLSVETLASSPEQSPGRPSLKVIEWEHIPENAERAVAAAADCNVLAVEVVADNKRERRDWAAAATIFLSSTATAKQHSKARKYVEQRDDGTLMAFFGNLQGTDKRIAAIDIDKYRPTLLGKKPTPAYDALQEGQRLGMVYNNAFNAGRPSGELKTTLIDSVDKIASSNVDREAEDLTQIDEIVEMYKGTNAKIGVLVGANHTPVGHTLSRTYPTERVSVSSLNKYTGPQERQYYPSFDQLIRHRRFFPEKPLPDGLLNKMLVADTYGAYVPAQDTYREVSRLTERMTQNELSETVLAIDAINAAIKDGPHARAERATRLGASVSAIFDELKQRQKI